MQNFKKIDGQKNQAFFIWKFAALFLMHPVHAHFPRSASDCVCLNIRTCVYEQKKEFPTWNPVSQQQQIGGLFHALQSFFFISSKLIFISIFTNQTLISSQYYILFYVCEGEKIHWFLGFNHNYVYTVCKIQDWFFFKHYLLKKNL